MPTDDREKQFERALTRHLRDRADATCPDAEVLSAYQERSLSLGEMAKWTEHIASCGRCQETLALVEQTENVNSHEWDENDAILLLPQAAAKPSEFRPAATRMAMEEASLPPAAAAAGAIPQPKVRARPPWKWIVPIGAMAAGVIVWLGVNELQKQQHKQTESVQLVENQPAATPTPAARAPLAVGPTPRSDGPAQRTSKEEKALREGGLELRSAPAARMPSAEQPSNPNKLTAPRAVPLAKQELDKKKDKQGEGSGSGYGIGVAAPAPPAAGALAGTDRDGYKAPAAPSQNTRVSGGIVAGAPAGNANAPVRAVPKSSADAKTADLSTITGRVLDPSGAGISGAVITAIATTSGSSKSAVADAAGNFKLTDLPSDQYRVVVAQAGFARSEQMLTLESRRDEQLTVQLKLGAVSEMVEVTGAAPAVNTQTSDSLAASPVEKSAAKEQHGRNFSPLLQLAAVDPHYIAAPDQKFGWRVGDRGKIEHTTDRGKTWQPQNGGVTFDLRTGSATSDKVCWAIGKSGTILLTTDGGKHWKQITSPISEDLAGIHAGDAQHASIWDVSHRKSFETEDGGATWQRTAHE